LPIAAPTTVNVIVHCPGVDGFGACGMTPLFIERTCPAMLGVPPQVVVGAGDASN